MAAVDVVDIAALHVAVEAVSDERGTARGATVGVGWRVDFRDGIECSAPVGKGVAFGADVNDGCRRRGAEHSAPIEWIATSGRALCGSGGGCPVGSNRLSDCLRAACADFLDSITFGSNSSPIEL